ncbi:TPA: restriction endonuclease subunit S [Streptococcus suis]
MMSKKSPQLRFEGFTDDWEERKLGELANIVRGASPRPIQDPKWFDTESDVGWLRISDVTEQNGRIHYLKQRISKLGQEKTRVLTEPHLLLSIAATVGKPVVNYVKTGVHDGFLIFLNPIFEREFIFQWLEMFRPKWQKYGQPGSQVNLNSELVRNQEISLPSGKEQQKISNFFKQLDDTIALHQRKLDLLKEQKKGYLQKMFPKNGEKVPELRFAGFADDWEERKLGDVGNTFTGLTGKTKEDFGHGSAKFVTYVNVFQNPIATLDQLDAIEIDEKQNQVQKGDIFFTTSSETPEEVGMSSVWTHDTENVYLNSFTFGYRPRVSFDLNYMASMLRSPSIRKKITFLAQGISRYNISKTKMLEIEIPTPTLSEQEKIGSFFKQLDNTIALHQRKLDLLKEQKKGFLQKMFV